MAAQHPHCYALEMLQSKWVPRAGVSGYGSDAKNMRVPERLTVMGFTIVSSVSTALVLLAIGSAVVLVMILLFFVNLPHMFDGIYGT